MPSTLWCAGCRFPGSPVVVREGFFCFARLSLLGRHQRPVPWVSAPLFTSPVGIVGSPLDFELWRGVGRSSSGLHHAKIILDSSENTIHLVLGFSGAYRSMALLQNNHIPTGIQVLWPRTISVQGHPGPSPPPIAFPPTSFGLAACRALFLLNEAHMSACLRPIVLGRTAHRLGQPFPRVLSLEGEAVRLRPSLPGRRKASCENVGRAPSP